MTKLKKELGILQLVFLGISNIIGAGIYVIGGIASGISGPSVIFSFLTASFVAILISLVICELASAITKTGEVYIYTKRAFGNYIGFITGCIRLLSSIFSTSVVALSFSFYLTAFFFPSLNSNPIIFLISTSIIVFSTIMNIVGISKMIRFATFLTIFKLFALSFFIIVGIFYLKNKFDEKKIYPIFPNGIEGMMRASTLAFFAYIGFQTIALASEESKNPKKDVPLAIFLSIFISSIFYILIVLIQILIVDWKELREIEYSLLYVMEKMTHNFYLNLFITSSALSAMLSVLLTTIYSSSRIVFAMSRDKLLPEIFSIVSKKHKTPIYSIIFSSIISIIILIIRNISVLVSFVSFGYLFTFLLTSFSLIKLKKKIKAKFKLPFHPTIPLLSIFFIILLMIYLEDSTKLIGIFFLTALTIIYFFLVKNRYVL